MINATKFIKLLDRVKEEIEITGTLIWNWEKSGDCIFQFDPLNCDQLTEANSTLTDIFANHGIQITDSYTLEQTFYGIVDHAVPQRIVVVDRRGANIEHYPEINLNLIDTIVNYDSSDLYKVFRDDNLIVHVGTSSRHSVDYAESFCSVKNGLKHRDDITDLAGIVVIVATDSHKPHGYYRGLTDEELDLVALELKLKPGIPNRLGTHNNA